MDEVGILNDSTTEVQITRKRMSATRIDRAQFPKLSVTRLRADHRSGSPRDPAQVRLTAAHEMGHALGLPHSDSQRDVMYPTTTATSMSARDYRTIEVLYATPDGTVINP